MCSVNLSHPRHTKHSFMPIHPRFHPRFRRSQALQLEHDAALRDGRLFEQMLPRSTAAPGAAAAADGSMVRLQMRCAADLAAFWHQPPPLVAGCDGHGIGNVPPPASGRPSGLYIAYTRRRPHTALARGCREFSAAAKATPTLT